MSKPDKHPFRIGEEKIFFAKIKEGRDTYFVEYLPPLNGFPFATLHLIFPTQTPAEEIARFMEIEGRLWLERYPVPVMVSAFGPTEDSISLSGTRPADHYTVLLVPGTQEVRGYWRRLKNEELPETALNRSELLSVYAGLQYRTSSEIKAQQEKSAHQRCLGWYVIFIWTAVAPGAFLVLEYFGPQWLATLVFSMVLYKALEKGLKLTGTWKKSAREQAKEEDERRMHHHHYHCSRNPESFLRLKFENFDKELLTNTQHEVEELNVKMNSNGPRN